MSTPSSASLIAAARDTDLRDRFIALGATLGVPQGEIELALPRLVGEELDGGTTIAAVYEYAALNYVPKLRPGQDPASVTDSQIMAALGTIGTQ